MEAATVDDAAVARNSFGAPRKELLFKVLVIGELGAGKTSLIKRYVHQYFSEHYRNVYLGRLSTVATMSTKNRLTGGIRIYNIISLEYQYHN